ncbi:DVU0259 family response regulator domain-containing protein [Desulfobacula sp.]|uniref:DVU0259 family response regulator domain-containing protein n=1 Tax=Desulfobacula sp. TaxID=2593537 RepID=UPI002613A0CA|nr:response regulator [Desulfobacula sp.]
MKKKILVIDDDLNIRDYLVSLFNDNGYDACLAGDVKEGLKVAKKNKPDLITLDIEMPGEWGPRLYRQLSQDPQLKNIPVIVISGLSGHQYAVVKAVASLSKPFDRDELLKIVKETLT